MEKIQMSRTNILSSKTIRLKVYRKSKGLCASCNKLMLFSSHGSNPPWDTIHPEKYVNGLNSIVFSIDHIKPVSKGGSDHQRNLQGLCITCNKKKADK